MFNNTHNLEFNNDKNEALEKLQQMLEEALEIGADSIELEYVEGGLEVCYMFGGSGVGRLLADRRLESEIIALIIDKAKLENKSRGVMGWTHWGKQYTITVEEYEHFGESAFRLILKKPKRKAS